MGFHCIEWFTKEIQQFATYLETVFWGPRKTSYILRNEKVRDSFNLASSLYNQESKIINYRGPAHESYKINYQGFHGISECFWL